MLFLLPPSETKAYSAYPGAQESALSVRDVSLSFGSLEPAREQAAQLLEDPGVLDAPTMMAIDRYTGTLYGGIHGRGLKGTPSEFAHLSAEAVNRAKESVLIQSALFGLIPATGLIPSYKGSATPKLKAIWAEPHQAVFRRLKGLIIDMRSKQYVALAPIPEDVESYWLDVVLESADGTRGSMNHFNKKSKGELIHAVLNSKQLPETIADLRRIAKKAGFGLELSGRELTLVVSYSPPNPN
jgi:cytoplasmic iron level regulating protein YaaA (DUF328/UPF0246 family)